ncbi:MAG: DUF2207 domain-containing protein [Methylobacter sp.]|nr:DUF2207 domain-containing protein [Methylobacter sp.]
MKKIAIFLILALLGVSERVFAKDPFHWEFINVEIDLQENGDMLVKETQQYVFDSAYSDLRYRWIPLDGIDRITDISVTEDGKLLNIKTDIESDRQWIQWTRPVNGPERQTFVLNYRVIGGVAIHKDGDVLHWTAIFKGHSAPVNATKVTVKYPLNLAGHVQSYQSAIPQKLNSQTVEFVYEKPLSANQGFDVSVTFTSGILNMQHAQNHEGVSKEVSIGLGLMLLSGLVGSLYVTKQSHRPVGIEGGEGGAGA